MLSRAATSPLTISNGHQFTGLFVEWLADAGMMGGRLRPTDSLPLYLPQQCTGICCTIHPSVNTLTLRHSYGDADFVMRTLLFCPIQLKRLRLDGVDLFDSSNLYMYLGEMAALEELVLSRCTDSISHQSRRSICLPQLQRLHLEGDLYTNANFTSVLELSRPLLFIGYDDFSEDQNLLDPDQTSEQIQRLVSTTTISQATTTSVRPDFLDHYCTLRAGGPMMEYGEVPMDYQLIAWNRKNVEASELISWLREGDFLPMLPSMPAEAGRDRRMSALCATEPNFYITTTMDVAGEPGCCVLTGLRRAFSLRSVVFASIMESSMNVAKDRHRYAFAPENVYLLLLETPSLLVLEMVNVDLGNLILAINPHDNGVPVPDLQELWLENVSFKKGERTATSLDSCLAVRAQKGSPLKKLTLRTCSHIGHEELKKLWDMEGLKVELFESSVTTSTDAWLKTSHEN